jgi:hypothetical protein
MVSDRPDRHEGVSHADLGLATEAPTTEQSAELPELIDGVVIVVEGVVVAGGMIRDDREGSHQIER